MNHRKIHKDYFLKKAQTINNLKKKKVSINNSNSFNKNSDLYKETLNYNIESTKTLESKQKDDENISMNNNKTISVNKSINSHKFNTINITNKSDLHLRDLENQIKIQKKQINQLLEYKDICEKRIKSLNPEEMLPLTIDSLNPIFYTNKSEKNLHRISKIMNSSYSYNNVHMNTTNKINGKTLDINSYTKNNGEENIYKNKYLILFRKYSRLMKDNKNKNIYIIKLKNIIKQLKSENESIINLLKSEKEKIKYEYNNCEKNLSDKSNEWKEQAEKLRKDLVLSQAMVNNLKSEIEILNRNKPNRSLFNIRNINIEDELNINKNENLDLFNENNYLKKSLSEKNKLISNLLEENYKLNHILNSIGINSNDISKINQNISQKTEKNISIIKEMKNIISQYENKFEFFNDYINNIKKEINTLYQDLNQIINDNKFMKTNNNNQKLSILSNDFYQSMNHIKNEIKDINIDFYNLDYTNDVKCIDNYKILFKIFIDELNKLILINKNFDFINEKENKSINELLSLCKNLISNNNFQESLNDILKINNNINQLYKQKILNDRNKNMDIDTLISNQVKEIENKKKILLTNSNIRKTYYITSKSRHKSKGRINIENKMKNIDDYNSTTYKNSKKNYFRNSKSLESNKYFNTHKKSCNSKDKIIFK